MLQRAMAAAVTLVLLSSPPLPAEEPPQLSGPVKEHEVLKRFAGQWVSESQTEAAPGEPASTCTGTLDARMIGGLWVVADMAAEMDGASWRAVLTIGYDPERDQGKGRYVGTWVDSIMNHLWQYEGTLSADGKTLTLEAEGPNMMTGEGTATYRDIYEFKSPDHIATTSLARVEGGDWVTFVTGDLKRKKPAAE